MPPGQTTNARNDESSRCESGWKGGGGGKPMQWGEIKCLWKKEKGSKGIERGHATRIRAGANR